MKEFEATNIDEAYALDWVKLAKALYVYADQRILRYLYGGRSLVNAKSAEDFASEAIAAFWGATDRKWNPAKCPNVFGFLCGAVNSLIDKEAKLVETKKTTSQIATGVDGDDLDLVENMADDCVLSPDERFRASTCKEFLAYLKSSVDDPELEQLLTAYELQAFKPREVEELTDIPKRRVSELKRKLREKVFSFPETEKYRQILGEKR